MLVEKFVTTHIIKETYLDTFGHMNNARYLSLFEEARWEFITQNGFGIKTMLELGLGPTILEINLKFLKELRVRDEVEIETQVISYTGKIGKLQQKMLINNEVYCLAEFTIGLFDLNTRKLILPTKEWLTAVGIMDQTE
jgi:thioesterase-3